MLVCLSAGTANSRETRTIRSKQFSNLDYEPNTPYIASHNLLEIKVYLININCIDETHRPEWEHVELGFGIK